MFSITLNVVPAILKYPISKPCFYLVSPLVAFKSLLAAMSSLFNTGRTAYHI